MVLKNLKIVLEDRLIENGYLIFKDEKIEKIGEGDYVGEAVDCHGQIAMPGFIDVHIHGSAGIDFMDAEEGDYPKIADTLHQEGVTSFLATTLTSDSASLERVCQKVNRVKDAVPIHPVKHKAMTKTPKLEPKRTIAKVMRTIQGTPPKMSVKRSMMISVQPPK